MTSRRSYLLKKQLAKLENCCDGGVCYFTPVALLIGQTGVHSRKWSSRSSQRRNARCSSSGWLCTLCTHSADTSLLNIMKGFELQTAAYQSSDTAILQSSTETRNLRLLYPHVTTLCVGSWSWRSLFRCVVGSEAGGTDYKVNLFLAHLNMKP